MAWSDAARAAAAEARKRNSQGKKMPMKALERLGDTYISKAMYGTQRQYARSKLTYLKALSAKSGHPLKEVAKRWMEGGAVGGTLKKLQKQAGRR